jgi:dTDP-4-amino-4,6-dideoxygalactose transaminase
MSKLAIDGGARVRTEPFPPWPYFFDDEIQEVEKVLREGRVNYWTGTRGREFQERFARFCGAKHGIAVMNGTAALHTALAAAGIGPGDEVIVPPRSFVATAFSVLHQNAVPVFADIDPVTHNIDVRSIRERISERTRAVICVHLAGLPCDMDPIMELAVKFDLKVIEDSAQAHGGRYKGRITGTLGHIAAFSFCNDKIITTGGEGGMVVTDSDDLAQIARSVKDHGYEEVERRNLLELEALYTYVHHRMGFNYRMTEMQAAIGLKALEKLEWNLKRRRENARYLTAHLANHDALIPPFESEEFEHAYYKYYVRLDPEKIDTDRDTFVKALRAEGVPAGLGTSGEGYRERAFQELAGYGGSACPFRCPWYEGQADYTAVELPNAKRVAGEIFVLPVHPTLEKPDLEDFIAALEKVLAAYGR